MSHLRKSSSAPSSRKKRKLSNDYDEADEKLVDLTMIENDYDYNADTTTTNTNTSNNKSKSKSKSKKTKSKKYQLSRSDGLPFIMNMK